MADGIRINLVFIPGHVQSCRRLDARGFRLRDLRVLHTQPPAWFSRRFHDIVNRRAGNPAGVLVAVKRMTGLARVEQGLDLVPPTIRQRLGWDSRRYILTSDS